MKFLCVPCDTPMKLQTVGPPERGSLSVVYSCPECGYEMAMLTNRVRDADRPVARRADRPRPTAREARRRSRAAKCPFAGDDAGDGPARAQPGDGHRRPLDRRGRSAGSRTFPSSSAPWRGPASRNSPGRRGTLEVDETILDAARDFFGM